MCHRSEQYAATCRYVVGLEKLQASAAAVSNMQDELTALQPQLVKTVGEVEGLMFRIGKEKAEVVEPKAKVVLCLDCRCTSAVPSGRRAC